VRIQLEPAYVLSVRAYRESSALLEAFTATHGRAGIVARGARAMKSKLRAVLQPFQRVLLSWSERGELGTLTAAECTGPPAALRGEAIFSGWYLNELILRLLQRRDPHAQLFDAYVAALSALPDDPARALRLFEKRLLTELGYGLQLPADLAPDAWYAFDPESGLRPASGPGAGSYRGASLLALEREALDTDESLRDARRLLRAAIEPHLDGRALRTPAMLRALREVRGQRPEVGK
jgi:DNA repair protein RecO (recombination protein O)